ncbi:class A beta-lactamase [Jiangella sp. DSM 45060]|uniref:class A beta-lactamase n=1 Tax=Jiangella sp. DSM 45060 TaxID=1798224 RepID=UPI00087CA308|nr:class A beta-lactamase [Jiangella sp. DSM 45060]SDT28608.1 beta-lactamase class A [Jiangella sp. DSM 45060]
MTRPLSRRTVLRAGLAVPLAASAGLLAGGGAGAASPGPDPAVRELERAHDVTLGVSATNLATGARLAHRSGDRFPILSVFKSIAAAAVLRDLDESRLEHRVWYPPADIVLNSAITAEHVDTGMTVAELCDAAIRFSDNAAGNLLLRELGGPRGLTAFARSIGDDATRLDRWEIELNSAEPGDVRDTSTPAALARTLAGLLVGDLLRPRDRRRLRDWMLANTTSGPRFRDALPDGWRLADKTGAGDYGTNNDAGVAWNPAGQPIVIVAMSRRDERDAPRVDAALADVARLVVRRLG